MDNQYNFYNFEALFKKFLVSGNQKPVSIKNYLSDLRHFLGWLNFKLKVKNQKLEIEAIQNLNQQLVQEYQLYLLENKVPIKTINRRLSTLRKFFSFCISQGWLKENPAKKIENIKPREPINPISLILYQKENPNPKELEVIKEFISFIS